MNAFRIKILELDSKLIVLCLDHGIISQEIFGGTRSSPSRSDLAKVFKILNENMEFLRNRKTEERDIGVISKYIQKSVAESKKRYELDIIIFNENGKYRAQGLQIDFLAKGKTLDELFINIVETLSKAVGDRKKKLNAASEYFFLKWSDMRATYFADTRSTQGQIARPKAVIAA